MQNQKSFFHIAAVVFASVADLISDISIPFDDNKWALLKWWQFIIALCLTVWFGFVFASFLFGCAFQLHDIMKYEIQYLVAVCLFLSSGLYLTYICVLPDEHWKSTLKYRGDNKNAAFWVQFTSKVMATLGTLLGSLGIYFIGDYRRVAPNDQDGIAMGGRRQS